MVSGRAGSPCVLGPTHAGFNNVPLMLHYNTPDGTYMGRLMFSAAMPRATHCYLQIPDKLCPQSAVLYVMQMAHIGQTLFAADTQIYEVKQEQSTCAWPRAKSCPTSCRSPSSFEARRHAPKFAPELSELHAQAVLELESTACLSMSHQLTITCPLGMDTDLAQPCVCSMMAPHCKSRNPLLMYE